MYFKVCIRNKSTYQCIKYLELDPPLPAATLKWTYAIIKWPIVHNEYLCTVVLQLLLSTDTDTQLWTFTDADLNLSL